MKNIKRLLSLVLCICMVLSMMPATALTVRAEETLTGWQLIEGAWYYYHEDGSMAVNQWQQSETGEWHYLGADGKMAVNTWVQGTDGNWYYVDPNGVRQDSCDHSGSQHETASDKGDGTHSFKCTVCGAETAEAHSAADSATGKCALCQAEVAAVSVTVGSEITYYATIDAANAYIKSLEGSDRAAITLLEDTSATQNSVFTFAPKTIVLDLNGKNLTVWALRYAKGADVTVTGEGTIIVTNSHYIEADTKLTLESGTIQAQDKRDAVIVMGTFVMNGGTVRGDTRSGVDVQDCQSVVITGGVIDGGLVNPSGSVNIVLSGGTYLGGIQTGNGEYQEGLRVDQAVAEGYKVVDLNGKDVRMYTYSIDQDVTIVCAHTKGNTTEATCQNPAVCATCGETYGDVDISNHDEIAAYYDNGFCLACGGYEPATLVTADNAAELNLDESYIGYYAISNAGQLYWFADKVDNENAEYTNAKVVLTENITVNEGTVSASSTGLRVWNPIGHFYSGYDSDIGFVEDIRSFSGIFDGNGKTISGLYCNDDGAHCVSLIAYTDQTALVKNVNLTNSYFLGYMNIGGFVGINEGTVTGCINHATISGGGVEGGVVGRNEGTVELCGNTGTVTNTWCISGGIAGENTGYVRNCWNTGNIQTKRNYVGGIMGYNSAARETDPTSVVQNCWSTGTVTCDNNGAAGGVVGKSQYGRNENCYSVMAPIGELTGGATQSKMEQKTLDQFASGEVASLLGEAWGQTIGEDDVPVLGGEKVYYGYVDCKNQKYSNDSEISQTPLEHTYNNKTGGCGGCGVDMWEEAYVEIDGVIIFYQSVNDAFAAVESQTYEGTATILLINNCSLSSDATGVLDQRILPAKNILLDLNGKTLTGPSYVRVPEGGTLTVKDSFRGGIFQATMQFIVHAGGHLTLESGTLQNAAFASYDTVIVYGNDGFTMTGGKVYNATLNNAALNVQSNGSAEISGGTLEAASNVAIDVMYGSAKLTGGTYVGGMVNQNTLDQIVPEGYIIVASDGTAADKYQNKVSGDTFTVELCQNHIGGQATCAEQAKCAKCGKGYGDILLHHTPYDDDDDCSTPVVCSVCGGETTPAKEHNFDGGECANEGCNVWQTFTMTYYVDGEVVKTETYTCGSAYYLWTAENKDNLTFLGWAEEDGGNLVYKRGEYIWPEEDMTFYAVYSVVYTITYYAYNSETNDYWEDGFAQAAAGESMTLGTQYSNWFKCIGWATEPGGQMVYEAGEEITINGDLTLYSVVAPFSAKVDLGAEDAVYEFTEITGELPYSSVRVTIFPTRVGYIFVGFENYEIQTDEETGERYIELFLSEDTTITAQWEVCTHNAALEGNLCGLCKQPIETSVEISGVATRYMNLADAFEAVSDCTAEDKAVIKLLSFVDMGSKELTAKSGVFTLDLNGNTITSSFREVIHVQGADVTIISSASGGKIEAINGLYLTAGSVTLKNVTIEGVDLGVNVNADDGKKPVLTVDGAVITSGNCGIDVSNGGMVNILSGSISGKWIDVACAADSTLRIHEGVLFPGGIATFESSNHKTLNSLLAEGMAYWDGDTMLAPSDDAIRIVDCDVTVKAKCLHENGTTSYTNKDENQHAVTCSYCHNVWSEEHSYVKGKCQHCGAADPDCVAPEKFDITLAQVELGNSLNLYFLFPADAYADWTGCYAVVTKTYAGGRDDVSITVPAGEWTEKINGTTLKRVGFYNISAKEMGDEITIVVYNAEGEAISNEGCDSLTGYLTRMLAKNANAGFRRLAVDMLNYGAEAQVQFGYDTENLVNAGLTEEQKAYGTADDAACVNNQVKGDNVRGSSVELNDNIVMKVYFYNMTADMTATVAFTNHTGKEITAEVTPTATANGYCIVVDQLVVADMRTMVTVTCYNADGSVYGTLCDSVESYVARTGLTKPINQAIMKFADSALDYLHKKN